MNEKKTSKINQKECDYIGLQTIRNDPGQRGSNYISPSLNLILWLKTRNFVKDFTGLDHLSTDSTGMIDFNQNVETRESQSLNLNRSQKIDVSLSVYIRNVLTDREIREVKRKTKRKFVVKN